MKSDNADDFKTFQFQFGWFGRLSLPSLIHHHKQISIPVWMVWENSLIFDKDLMKKISIPVWMVWEKSRFILYSLPLQFQFQFGWFGSEVKQAKDDIDNLFQFQFGWFGS